MGQVGVAELEVPFSFALSIKICQNLGKYISASLKPYLKFLSLITVIWLYIFLLLFSMLEA